eukprot:g7677.t1
MYLLLFAVFLLAVYIADEAEEAAKHPYRNDWQFRVVLPIPIILTAVLGLVTVSPVCARQRSDRTHRILYLCLLFVQVVLFGGLVGGLVQSHLELRLRATGRFDLMHWSGRCYLVGLWFVLPAVLTQIVLILLIACSGVWKEEEQFALAEGGGDIDKTLFATVPSSAAGAEPQGPPTRSSAAEINTPGALLRSIFASSARTEAQTDETPASTTANHKGEQAGKKSRRGSSKESESAKREEQLRRLLREEQLREEHEQLLRPNKISKFWDDEDVVEYRGLDTNEFQKTADEAKKFAASSKAFRDFMKRKATGAGSG